MTERIGYFNETDARRIGAAVTYVEQYIAPSANPTGRAVANTQVYEGVLDEALAVATSITSPATATLSVYTGGTYGDSTRNIEVTNRDTEAEWESGAFLVVARINGEWRPVASTAGSASSAACEPRSEVWTLHVFGKPTTGTFTITFDSDTVTLNWNDVASAIETAFEAHTGVGSGNVSVTGGPLPNSSVNITFQGDLANMQVALTPPLLSHASLLGGAGLGTLILIQGGRSE